MHFLAIIPARGGSKGLPGKNLRPLAGKPLIAWSIEAARGAASIGRVVVSTDDEAIAEVARRHGAEVPFLRPAELALDDTPTLPVLQDTIRRLGEAGYRPDAVVTLQPTSPLRTARHIDEATALFMANPEADSLVSCVEIPHVYHPRSVMRLDGQGYLRPFLDGPMPNRRQAKEPVFARNGAAIYVTRLDCLSRFIFGGNLLPYMMSVEDSIDIDDAGDLHAAEKVIARRLGDPPPEGPLGSPP